MSAARTSWWTWAWPVASWLVLLLALVLGAGGLVSALAGIALFGAVFAAVYHAEVIAHRVGEPFGTLVLALAVTTIETALIVSVMIAAPAEKAGLARDTVFAAVMIVCNGIVGLSLLMGRPASRAGISDPGGKRGARRAGGPHLSCPDPSQLCGSGTRAGLYDAATGFRGLRVVGVVRRFRFRSDSAASRLFLPVKTDDEEIHEHPPSVQTTLLSAGLLMVSLVGIVGLAKALTPTVELTITRLDVPKAVVGVVIAALVLLPEALAALRAAQMNRLQTSLNLALGSALATIGLTIPAVAAVSIVLGQRLQLGLDSKDQSLLAITLFISVITFGTGRTTVLQGIVHLMIFAAFMFFAVAP